MSTTHTSSHVQVQVQTAVFLAEVIMGSIGDILAHLGIDLTRLYRDWNQDETAITAWVLERSLEAVVLECHRPDGNVRPVFEFPVSYDAGGAGTEFTASRAAMARYRAKLDRVPGGTDFALVCTFRTTPTPQPGWSPGSRASTAGLTALSFGTLGSAPNARASLRYLH